MLVRWRRPERFGKHAVETVGHLKVGNCRSSIAGGISKCKADVLLGNGGSAGKLGGGGYHDDDDDTDCGALFLNNIRI